METASKCFSCLKLCGLCCGACICCCCLINKFVTEGTFPAPKIELGEYETSLVSKEDLIWLRIKTYNSVGMESRARNPKPTKLIPALYIRAKNQFPADFTVIYSHGNAEDISLDQHYARWFAQQSNCDILCYEYPGYSLTRFTSTSCRRSVKRTEKGVCKAIEAAWRFLVDDRRIDPKKIIIYGRSIGSGPSVYLASRTRVKGTIADVSPQQVAGVFLISPLKSTVRVVLGNKTARCCFCYDKFPNHSRISKIHGHVAMMHARDDEVVPFRNGEQLYDMLQRKDFYPMWLDQGGHNDISADTILKYFLEFKAFLTGKTFDKYKNEEQKEDIRQKRLQNLRQSSKNLQEADNKQEDQQAVATQDQDPRYRGFIPNCVEPPVLTEFMENGVVYKRIDLKNNSPPVNAAAANRMSQDDIRRKRLEAMQKKH